MKAESLLRRYIKIILMSIVAFLLFWVLGALTANAQSASSFEWKSAVITDDFDDSKVVRAAVSNGEDYPDNVLLTLDCFDPSSDTGLGMSFMTDHYLGSSDTYKILLRVDDNEAYSAYHWASDESAIMYRNMEMVTLTDDFVRQMMSGSRLRVRVYDYDDDYYTYAFTLSKSEQHIRRVYKACGVTL